jgi:hypothetical protein
MNRQVLGNKRIPMDMRRRLYQAIVVNIALWGSEGWAALKEENRAKLETLHHNCCLCRICGWTMWDIAEKRITYEKGKKNCRNLTHNGIDDGNVKMPMALQTQRSGKVQISEANASRMVSNTTTHRETAADHTPRLHDHTQ